MPNYVTNIVTLNGSSEQIEKLLEHIAFDGHPGTFDFNKVVAMPASLDLSEGTIKENAVDAYLSATNPGNRSELRPAEKFSLNEFAAIFSDAKAISPFQLPNTRLKDDEIRALAERHQIESPEALINLGKQYLSNYQEYGAATWYSWSIKNWGTKWNNDCETPVTDGESGILLFDTAWSMPEPIYEELSRQYPDLILDVRWADEDLGYNVGQCQYQNGTCISEYIPEAGSPEAIEMALDIKGLDSGEIIQGYPELDDLMQEAKTRAEAKQQDSPDKTHPSKTKDAPEL